MSRHRKGKALHRGMVSLTAVVFLLLLVPPTHEFVHAYNCWSHGGDVKEVDYWGRVVCSGNVADGEMAELNLIDRANQAATSVLFYMMLFPALGLGAHSSYHISRHYLEKR